MIYYKDILKKIYAVHERSNTVVRHAQGHPSTSLRSHPQCTHNPGTAPLIPGKISRSKIDGFVKSHKPGCREKRSDKAI